MKVRFSDRALAYLRSEQTYLGHFDKGAARATARQIRKAAEIIGEYPYAGQAVPMVPGVRRYVTAPYILDYVETDGAIISWPFGTGGKILASPIKTTNCQKISKRNEN